MKIKTIVASGIAVALVIFAGLQLFASRTKHTAQPLPIEGKWQVDSVYALDTAHASTGIVSAIRAAVTKDRTFFQFNADSTVLFTSTNDTSYAKYYLRDSLLFINSDSVFHPYTWQHISDSTVSYMGGDSIVFVLKKK